MTLCGISRGARAVASIPSTHRDPEHERLRVALVDVDGTVADERDFPAPLNKNSQATWMLRVSVVHDDGCSRVIADIPIAPY